MTGGPHRVTIGADPVDVPWAPAEPVYGAGVRAHDPYRGGASARAYDVPQLDPDPAQRPLADGPVRVLAYVDRYPPARRRMAGGEMMLHHLLRDSAARGHTVTVATNTPERYEYEGVAVVPERDAAGNAAVADVMVGHLMWTRRLVELAVEAKRPLVYIVHNDRQIGHWKLTVNNVTSVVWNSQWVADATTSSDRWHWPAHTPGVVIPPPVLLDDYDLGPDHRPWDAPYVTLVNPNPEKGADVLYALAAGPPARQYLAVEGAYGEQRRPTGETPNVDWQDQTPRMRDEVYARTRVLIVPSVYESWGRVALEAMAAGIPPVVSPTPGLREACGDAVLYADPGDLDAWRTALATLDNRVDYHVWSAKARARAALMSARSTRDLDLWDKTLREAAAVA